MGRVAGGRAATGRGVATETFQMNHVIRVFDHVGSFGGRSEAAIRFRQVHIEPLLIGEGEIEIDFSEVRSTNSSFCNALVANLIELHPEALERICFSNCRPAIRLMIESAIELGLERLENKRLAS
jgi:hypothetical protein